MSQYLQSFTLEICILNGRSASASLSLVLAWLNGRLECFYFRAGFQSPNKITSGDFRYLKSRPSANQRSL